MIVRCAGSSQVGRVRSENQDVFAIGPLVGQSELLSLGLATDSELLDRFGLLVAVADGMGGYAGGGLASRVLMEAFVAHYHRTERPGASRADVEEAIRESAAAGRSALVDAVAGGPSLQDAGTTLAGIVIMGGGGLVVFNVGDSRVVWANGTNARQLTVDHTLTVSPSPVGHRTDGQTPTAVNAPLTNWIGADRAPEIDFALDDVWRSGDRFAIGSDGWHGEGRGLSFGTVCATLRWSPSDEVACGIMVHEAVETDGSDNATVVVVGFEEAA